MSVFLAPDARFDLYQAFQRIELLKKHIISLGFGRSSGDTLNRMLDLTTSIADSLKEELQAVDEQARGTGKLLDDISGIGLEPVQLNLLWAQNLRKKTQHIAKRASSVLDCLEALEPLSDPSFDSSTMESFAKALFQIEPGARMLYYYEWRHNFQYWELVTDLQKLWREKPTEEESSPENSMGPFNQAPSHCVVVSLSMCHKLHPLIQVMVGHEIGHFIVEREEMVQKMHSDLMKDDDINKEIEYITKAPDDLDKHEETLESLEDTVETHGEVVPILEDMIKEFAADCFCALLLGFAAPLVVEAVTFEIPITEISEDNHPAPAARLYFMYKTLEHLDLIGALSRLKIPDEYEEDDILETMRNALLERIESFGDEDNLITGLGSDRDESLQAVAQKTLCKVDFRDNIIKQMIDGISPHMIFNEQDILPILRLAKKIIHEEPPNELTDTNVKFKHILNAGWFAYAYEKNRLAPFSFKKGSEWANWFDDVNHLVERAIEMNDLKHKFERQKVILEI